MLNRAYPLTSGVNGTVDEYIADVAAGLELTSFPTIDPNALPVETIDKGSAKDYKGNLANRYGVYGVFTRVSPGVRAQMYDKLSRTANAIESGRKEGYFYNTASKDVTMASIAFLENCRKELEKIESSTHLSSAEKSQAREHIYAQLEIVRRANSGIKTKDWFEKFGPAFSSALSKEFGNINLKRAFVTVVGLVVVGVVFSVLLSVGVLGPFAPFAMPLVFCAAAAYVGYKLVQGVRSFFKALFSANAAVNAEVNAEKTKLGKQVIENAAIYAERDLKIAMAEKQDEVEGLELAVEEAAEDLERATELLADNTITYEELKKLDKALATLKDAITSPAGSAGEKYIQDWIAKNTTTSGSKKVVPTREAAIQKIRVHLLPEAQKKMDDFVLKKGQPSAIEAKQTSLIEGKNKCSTLLQQKKALLGSKQKELEDLPTGKLAQAEKLALAREDRSLGVGSAGSMKDVLEEGRKARVSARAAVKSDSDSTHESTSSPTMKKK